jgi:hypothetical protein
MFIETEREMTEATVKYRQDYLDGLYAVLGERRREYDGIREKYIDPVKCAADRERYRTDLMEMLGWPLTDHTDLRKKPLRVTMEKAYDLEYAAAYRMTFEVLPGLRTYGVYFESVKNGTDKPFAVLCHGGVGTPEVIAETFETNNYNGIVRRVCDSGDGVNVFCPMFHMWAEKFGPPLSSMEDMGYERTRDDARLKQVGSSTTAIEVFAIMRELDWFMGKGIAKEGHIGIAGLSYGGFYATMTAACDTRFAAAYSSCQFSDRYRYGREDWIWHESGAKFLDAEISGLIAPRPFFVEEGERDDLFDVAAFRSESERAAGFYEAAGVPERFISHVHPGTHEIALDDTGVNFLYENTK